ncbi:MAG: methionine--tRNA ligase [Planctomycetia bacterium]|nr:methionine--tRNA ligase [Planctomycetia bacterium]
MKAQLARLQAAPAATRRHAPAAKPARASRRRTLLESSASSEGRQVCAGVKAWYAPEELVGKQVVIVANLEPRKLRGEISQGMILAASDLKDAPTEDAEGKPGPDERDVVVVTIDKPVKPGSRVS